MLKIAVTAAAIVVVLHGLVHLMGFVAYWPLAEVGGLPYKTVLWGERWAVGRGGMRAYSVLWLLAAAALVGASMGLLAGRSWWPWLLGAAVLLSLALIAADWSAAFRGALVNLAILLPLLVVFGLRTEPASLAPFPQVGGFKAAADLPADLPPPVTRFFQVAVGERLPVIDSAVITARGTVRVAGITFPARMRFTHDAGRGYRHFIEATLFGRSLLTVNERYLDGQAWLSLPVGVVENEPKVDSAANLGLWGESLFLPSIYVTDPRVRWAAIDATSARLLVPFGNDEQSFTVVFDEETGLMREMSTLRYREAADEAPLLWVLEVRRWARFNGVLVPAEATATWADEGTPWLVMRVEEIVYNPDIRSYIRQEGP